MDLSQVSQFSQKKTTFPVENSLERRSEVDTSTPFESVKEAVDRFGGSALWNSQLRMLFFPKINVEEQTDQLEKVPFVKIPEVPKRIMDYYFESQLQKEEISEVNKIHLPPQSSANFHPISQKQKENPFIDPVNKGTINEQSSGSILDELELAKMNLSKTTGDLTKIRSFIETLNNEIDSERTIQEKTPEKLSSLGTIVSFLEEDLKKTTLKLQITNETNDNWNKNPTDVCREIKQLRSHTQQFRQTAIASKSEALNLTSEIEKMQSFIKTAEIRRLAAKKMEEAAKAAESIAISRIKDIEEHSSRKKIEASFIVGTSNLTKLGLLEKVKEAATDVKTSRNVLEEALNCLEAANSRNSEGKLWKLPEKSKLSFGQVLSIGEILRKKLIGLEEYEHAIKDEKSKLSFGQVLNRKPGILPPLLVAEFACKKQPLKRKRKKFGFVGMSYSLM